MKIVVDRFNRIKNTMRRANPLLMDAIEKSIKDNSKDIATLTLDHTIYLFHRAAIEMFVDKAVRDVVMLPFKQGISKDAKKTSIEQARKKIKSMADLSKTDETVLYLEGIGVINRQERMALISSGIMSLYQALNMWEFGKVVFDFDVDLYLLLADTDIKLLPVELLNRLPYHCFYVLMPFCVNISGKPINAYGFWVYTDVYQNKAELCILVDVKDCDGDDSIYPFRVNLGFRDLDDAVVNSTMAFENEHIRLGAIALLRGLINVILYLCSENADIIKVSSGTVNQASTRKKTGGAPVKVFECGYRVSGALKCRYEKGEGDSFSGKKVSSHIRRAHWHTYLTGPKGDKVRVLKWLSPIAVNVDESEYIPTFKRVGVRVD
ncbi:hypothetical protein RI528_00280 [Aeromonas veronii]|uniref:hypothetical protein n=1 Tax=Aeromonas TaxID=642 RepID=UPI003449D377